MEGVVIRRPQMTSAGVISAQKLGKSEERGVGCEEAEHKGVTPRSELRGREG